MTVTVPAPASFGVSGNTSSQMLDRVGSFAIDDIAGCTAIPDLALIFGFPNDPVNGISQASTQLNAQALALAIKHAAYGEQNNSGGAYVANPAALPANGRPGQRYVVLADNDTSGGRPAWMSTQAATITGSVASSAPAVWEQRNKRAGVSGWGRIAVSATTPTACKRVVFIGTNYKNFFTDGGGSGGAASSGKRDTLTTPEPFYAAARTATQAAVTAENVTVGSEPSVVYADLYALQKAMIQGGTIGGFTFAAGYVPDFSGGATYDATKDWHYTPGNQHHNEFGHWVVAAAAWLAVQSAGWLVDLPAIGVLNVKALGDSQTDLTASYVQNPTRTWVPTLGTMLRDYLGAA